jgi:hypothetical protein
MQPVTINLATLVAILTVTSLAGGAVVWALRRVDDVGWIPRIRKALFGDDEEKSDSKVKLGMLRRQDQTEDVVAGLSRFMRALCIALRIPPTSDEHKIVEAVERAIDERAAGMIAEQSGGHPAIARIPTARHPALSVTGWGDPPPVRRPTPWRGETAIRREEPEPPPREPKGKR